MRQSACLVFNPITVNNFAPSAGPVGSGVIPYDGPDLKLLIVGWGLSFIVCCSANRGLTGVSLSLQIFSGVV